MQSTELIVVIINYLWSSSLTIG